MSSKIRESAGKTFNAFKNTMPILIGVLLLISLLLTAVPREFYAAFFTGNPIIDPFVGALFGSIAAGNPINSYVIGGELLKNGVSLLAVVAFIVAWVTVGVVQFPAESLMLGKRFAFFRNATSFVLSIIIAVLMVFTLGVLG